ncbi:hypothetical protein HQ590_11060 [bacterium]|nr:hypothetical protein [bacterium]
MKPADALVVGLALLPLTASAQLELVPGDVQHVFAGKPQIVRVMFHNPTDKPAATELTTRLWQVSSGAVMPVGEAQPWKELEVLPRQTVLETIELTFPEVAAPTRFRVQWGGLGRTDIDVYPPNLLKQLGTLVGEKALAVWDPDDHLRGLLRAAKTEFADYESETPTAPLAIVWTSTARLPDLIVERVRKGMAAVWVRPQQLLVATAMSLGQGMVLVVPESLLVGLAESPAKQAELVRLANLALRPQDWQVAPNGRP